MKSAKYTIKLLILVLLLAVSTGSSKGQSTEQAMKAVSQAIRTSDADALKALFNSSVEVTVPGSDATYSANQATFVIKEFFNKYQPTSYESMHNGNSGATYYGTGTTQTAKGAFDTNIFLKKIEDKMVITQIRFEAE